MASTTDQAVQEIQSRTRRTETKVHKIAEHLGIADAHEELLQVEVSKIGGGNTIHVPGMDITLARLKRDLGIAGASRTAKDNVVMLDGCIVAIVTFF